MAERKPQLLTKSQRQAIEKELGHPYGRVDLKIDGHKVELRVERAKALQYVVCVYVDGFIRGANFKADSAIGAKFWRPETRCALGRKALADFTKAWGKREARKLEAKYTSTIHMPYFRSARGFLGHVQRTCEGIEVVAVGYASSEPTEATEAVGHG